VLILSGCAGISGEQVAACIIAMGGLEVLDVSSCRFGEKGANHIANALQSSEMRALVCADGKLYCEWQFNSKQAPVCKQGHIMSGPVERTRVGFSSNWCCDNAEKFGGKGCNSGLTDFGQAGDIKRFTCRQCEYDLCIKCAPMHTTKYICTDPGINGQNDEPTASVGSCVHCNKLKDQHHDKGALTSLNLASNGIGIGGYEGFGGFIATPEGPAAIADAIKDMRAISSINLLKNKIPVEQAQELVKIMQAKENLTTLCGLSRVETELNFSGQYLDAGDAMLIANDISDMRALSSLNLASNCLCGIDEHGRGTFDASGNARFRYHTQPAHTCLIAQVLPSLPMPFPIWGH
jgi:hypothetical protein